MDHPWVGLLLMEGETQAEYSRCAATLVDKCIIFFFTDFSLFPDWKQHLPDGSSLSTKLGWTDSGAFTAKNHPWGAEQDQVDLKGQVMPETCYHNIRSYSPESSMLLK